MKTAVIPDRQPKFSQIVEDLVGGLIYDDATVQPPLADGPSLPAMIGELDRGLDRLDGDADTDALISRPPLIARLIVPGGGRLRQLFEPGSAKKRNEVVGHLSAFAAAWLILATLLGATAATFVFHRRIAQVVVQWEVGRK